MESRYRLQIVFEDGSAVQFRAGRTHEEGRLADAIVAAALKRGIGLFRTQSHVRQAILDALDEVFMDLKRGVLP